MFFTQKSSKFIVPLSLRSNLMVDGLDEEVVYDVLLLQVGGHVKQRVLRHRLPPHLDNVHITRIIR